jgi:hypothetical protein
VSDPWAHWNTDANGNHDGLCCEDCGHSAVLPYRDAGMSDPITIEEYPFPGRPFDGTPLSEVLDGCNATVDRVARDLTCGRMPVGGVVVRPPDGDPGAASGCTDAGAPA